MTQPDDPYAVLGVPPSATAAELRRAYHRLSLKWHPDHHMQAGPEAIARAEAIFKSVNHAFVVASQILQSGPRTTPVQIKQRTLQEVQLATVAHAVTQSRLMMVAQYWGLNPYIYRRDVEVVRRILSDAVVFGARAFPGGLAADLRVILREQSLANEEEHVRALLDEAMQLILDRATLADVATWEAVFIPLGYKPVTPSAATRSPNSTGKPSSPTRRSARTGNSPRIKVAAVVGGVGVVLVLASIPLGALVLLAGVGILLILAALAVFLLV